MKKTAWVRNTWTGRNLWEKVIRYFYQKIKKRPKSKTDFVKSKEGILLGDKIRKWNTLTQNFNELLNKNVKDSDSECSSEDINQHMPAKGGTKMHTVNEK